jgi:uncharacterized delta-60 repeat protein
VGDAIRPILLPEVADVVQTFPSVWRWISMCAVIAGAAAAGACGSDSPRKDAGDGSIELDGGAGGAAGGGTSGSGGSGGCAPNAGTLDPTFGTAGVVVAHFANAAAARAVAVLPDGTIVAGGGPLLARFAPDGYLEAASTHAIDGNALAVQEDGKFVFAGSEAATGGDSFVLLRFNMNGTPDLGFGSSGGVVTMFTLMESAVTALAIQPADGRIVAAGVVGGRFGVARFDRLGGVLDMSFGGASAQPPGLATTSFTTGFARAQAVAVQEDGRIVLAGCGGTSSTACSTFALARLDGGGLLDATFGSGGKVLDQRFPAIAGVGARSAGVVTVGGDVVGRFKQSDGSLDTTFASTGTTQAPGGGSPAIQAVAVTADRKVIAAGSTATAADAGAARRGVVVRLNADGTPDTCFGTAGVTSFAGGTGDNVVRALALQPDGSLVVAGQAGTDILVVRLR